jgi:NADH:ubiquinone oxidoreductase subunit 4 (subunit M)
MCQLEHYKNSFVFQRQRCNLSFDLPLETTLAALGMILGAAYSLWLYNLVIFKNFKPKFLQKFPNLF